MREIASIELHCLVEELKDKITGSYIKKFYDLGEGTFRISFYKESDATTVYIKLSRTLNETGFVEESGEATQFAMGIRKRIENARVTGFYQKGSDRIVIFDVQSGGEKRKLILEMFSKGNLILCDDKMSIEICYTNIAQQERTIRAKGLYSFPKSEAYDLDKLDEEGIGKILERIRDDEKLISGLSRYINIGPIYLEDIIKRSGLDPKSLGVIGDHKKLTRNIVEFLNAIKKIAPRIYLKEGRVVDYSILPLEKYSGLEEKEYDTLSKLFDDLYIEGRAMESDVKSKEIEEMESNIDKQKGLAARLKDEVTTYAQTANTIQRNMASINEIVAYIKNSKKIDIEMLKSRFGERIKALDQRKKTIKIEA